MCAVELRGKQSIRHVSSLSQCTREFSTRVSDSCHSALIPGRSLTIPLASKTTWLCTLTPSVASWNEIIIALLAVGRIMSYVSLVHWNLCWPFYFIWASTFLWESGHLRFFKRDGEDKRSLLKEASFLSRSRSSLRWAILWPLET